MPCGRRADGGASVSGRDARLDRRAGRAAAQRQRRRCSSRVVAAKGSVPRAAGHPDGGRPPTAIAGTIGGGHLEYKAIDIARDLLADRGAAGAASLSAGREPRPVLRRRRAAAVRAGARSARMGRRAAARCATDGCRLRARRRRCAATRRRAAGRHRDARRSARWARRPLRRRGARRSPATLLAGQRRTAAASTLGRGAPGSRSSSTSCASPTSSSCCSAPDTSAARWCDALARHRTAGSGGSTRATTPFRPTVPANVDCVTDRHAGGGSCRGSGRRVFSGDDAQPLRRTRRSPSAFSRAGISRTSG